MSNKPEGGDWSTYKRLLGYIRPHWLLFLLSIVGFLVGSGAEAYFMTLFGDLIDSWDSKAVQASLAIPVAMFVVALVRAVGEVAGETLLSHISFSVVHNIRTQLFDQLLQMPSAYFDASSQGHLVSRLTYNVAQLRDTGTDALKSIIQDGGKVIVYFGAMFYFNWKLTCIFVAAAPVVALVAVYASRRFRRISRRIQRTMGDVTHVASETVSGYRVVRIFGGEGYERDRFYRSSRNNRRQNLKMVATKVSSTQAIQIFVALALAVLIGLLFRPEVGGSMTTGEVVAFLGFAGLLIRPIRRLSEINARLQRGLAAAEDVFSQLDVAEEADPGTVEVERVTGRIEFRDVSFHYETGSESILQGLNLTIEPGQTVALVGRSGSGKTTLASLIPRFYEPTSGEILLDEKPLVDYRLQSLRRQIALVTQQVTLFNDTLERNIAYGALTDSPPEKIHDAVVRAHADGFIADLPEGIQTVVGDDGVLLSGGQRQRVAIARALLKDAPILILDEATSSLDTESERHIQSALEEVIRGRTTLVIAHRLSTIEKADVIVVIDAGRVVETGTHSELLQAQGAYAELYQSQFEDDDSARPASVSGSAGSGADTSHQPAAPVPRKHIPLVSGGGRSPGPWYSGARWPLLLSPLAWLFAVVARRRRVQFLTGQRASWRASVPVIVIGNITVGGTGKSPMVIWLARWLKDHGLQPGIVSRGYGGRARRKAQSVTGASDPDLVGDEAPMLAARTGCPVVVCGDRVAAVKTLLQEAAVDVVISDDGLQHYALARDLEIAMVDGHRGVGNGRYLPAGPLREPLSRLDEVDWVIANGQASGLCEREVVMRIIPVQLVAVTDGRRMSCEDFAARFPTVNALAGVGNPASFAMTLQEIGLQPVLSALPDHHRYRGDEVIFDNDWPVVCTEKDSIKISRLKNIPQNVWYLQIDVGMDPGASAQLAELLAAHGIHRAR
jgi:subfamily B ATP-binding cassette protein MsbA